MFAFILFTEGFGSWKAFLSCETWKLKLLQSSLNTDMSTKKLKQYSIDPNLVSQEKSDDFEISNKILATERDTEEILLNSNSNKDSEPGELSTGLTSPTESVENSSNLLHQKPTYSATEMVIMLLEIKLRSWKRSSSLLSL